MNEQRRHVDEFRRYIHIELLQIFDVAEILRRDLRDGNVVDVDVLLANQVEQQIQRPFINTADTDSERELAGFAIDDGRLRHESYCAAPSTGAS